MATDGALGQGVQEGKSPYESAVLGFRNYWYPVFSSKEVGDKPKGVTLLGDKVVFMRNKSNGKVYALADECLHRGTLLSSGRGCEFRSGGTITCPYHGWTYDLETGGCVAVLPEGPDSLVPGNVRTKTYPVEEIKGIVWIWMGSMEPEPLKEDLPTLINRDDNFVKFRHRIVYGNWRWHAENVNGGHLAMVHRDSVRMWSQRPVMSVLPGDPEVKEDVDGLGVHTPSYVARQNNDPKVGPEKGEGQGLSTDFPGLGRWYVPPLWRRILFWPWLLRRRPGLGLGQAVHGAAIGKLFLPGMFRQPHFPSLGDCYYEWYVPVDEDHYIYAQVVCLWGNGPIHRLWKHIWYHVWGKPVCLIQFNNQDFAITAQTTDFLKRHKMGIYPLTKVSRNDLFHTAWRAYANEYARGVGYRYQDRQRGPDIIEESAESRQPAVPTSSED